MPKIFVNGSSKAIEYLPGQNLLQILHDNDIFIENPCNGKGSCGKCKVKITEGSIGEIPEAEKKFLSESEIKEGVRLSCLIHPESDLVIETLDKEREHKILTTGYMPEFNLSPSISKKLFEIEKPSLENQISFEDAILKSLLLDEVDFDVLKMIEPFDGVATAIFDKDKVIAIEKGNTVIYVTIEQFMNDFTFSLKNKSMEHFRNKYRKCDVLLIDDIQFLSGKEQTQEEFFHTFNELHNAKKQIVMTSDRLPSQIAGLVDRLKSRFEWGLTADVQIPGLETKIAIIEKKSELNGISLSREIINFIATTLDNSIREIEGVLIRINASASLLNQEITLQMVQGLLKDQIKETKENIKLPDVINIVANQLNIKPSDIKSKKRTATVANARRIVIYLTRELTHNSMPDIAKFLGMKDHSSISHNIKKANELIEKDENFKLIIENLKNKIINKEW